jgi:hypothetical protein
MINLYAYTYPAAMKKYIDSGYILTKVGDSHRDVSIRMNEQGGAAEYEKKVVVGSWLNLKEIRRDFVIHEVLTKKGLHHQEGSGTEWFKIPGSTTEEAYRYLDELVTAIEGKRVRKSVKLRDVQKRTLDQAMAMIDSGKAEASLIANLCPRFGKTIWALSLFNRITEKYGNRVMLLPAYWLSAHSSFIGELDQYNDFLDIVQIDVDDANASREAEMALDAGKRIIIPISLHGDIEMWQKKHDWIADINNNEIFMFADEGDFGTHTDNQTAKLDFLFNKEAQLCL